MTRLQQNTSLLRVYTNENNMRQVDGKFLRLRLRNSLQTVYRAMDKVSEKYKYDNF